MLFDPTERNVDEETCPDIGHPWQECHHGRDSTSVPHHPCPDRRLHMKTAELPRLTDELGITVLSKQRFVITVPTNTRVPSPVKVQVRGGRHLPLSTPRLHQGCDGPPHTFKQWPAPLSSVWPYSGAPPVRIRTGAQGITGDRPRCVVRPLLYPVSNCVKGRKKILPLKGTPEQPYTSPTCFPQLWPTQHVPNYSTSPRWLKIIIRTWRTGHSDNTPRNDFHLPKNLRACFCKMLAIPHHANFLVPAVEKQASLQQDT